MHEVKKSKHVRSHSRAIRGRHELETLDDTDRILQKQSLEKQSFNLFAWANTIICYSTRVRQFSDLVKRGKAQVNKSLNC